MNHRRMRNFLAAMTIGLVAGCASQPVATGGATIGATADATHRACMRWRWSGWGCLRRGCLLGAGREGFYPAEKITDKAMAG